jgi:hypothetical protein
VDDREERPLLLPTFPTKFFVLPTSSSVDFGQGGAGRGAANVHHGLYGSRYGGFPTTY